LLARALAWALQAPFADGNKNSLEPAPFGQEQIAPLFLSLLQASEYDLEAAGQGIVFVDCADQPETQTSLARLWQAQPIDVMGRLRFDFGKVLFACGGQFPELWSQAQLTELESNHQRRGFGVDRSVTAVDEATHGHRPDDAARRRESGATGAVDRFRPSRNENKCSRWGFPLSNPLPALMRLGRSARI
jgi:hypothetical protein